jgi:hypothetical protein
MLKRKAHLRGIMKKLRAATTSEGLAASLFKTTLVFLLALGLGSSLWLASVSIVRAAAPTPAEMIQSNLPHAVALGSASKADVLSAVCKAVGEYRKDAPQIVRAAAGARKEFSGDIVGTAIRCLRQGKEGALDCELVRSILREGTAADPERAASLTELVLGLAPDCSLDTPAEGPGFTSTNPLANINAAPGSVGGAAGGDVCEVCHNTQELQIACSDLDSYLRAHPGDNSGPCVATPSINR